MTLLTHAQLAQLAARADGPHVSIYLPTHRAGREISQDPIRLKNLLTAAEADLVAQGARPTAVRDLLEPATMLLDDPGFWRHQGDGLAVFLGSGDMRLYRLPITVKELEVVADRFHVKPLLALLGRDGRFFILAVSLNRVRLFEATRDSIHELELGDVPETLRDAVGYDWEARSLQYHTGGGRDKGGRRRAMFHGHGSPKDDAQEEIVTFLRLVDDGVTTLLAGARAPLVLAGVGHILATFRSLTSYPAVLETGVEGNPDHLSAEALLAQAWPLVEPRFAAEQRAAADRYRALAATERAGGDLGNVLRAAFDGRVETLFAAVGTQRWGTFNEASRQVDEHVTRCPGDQDLVDLAAVQCLVTGAEVYAVEPECVPGGGPVAAIFRY